MQNERANYAWADHRPHSVRGFLFICRQDLFDPTVAQAQKEMREGNFQRSELLWRQADQIRPQPEYVVRWIAHCLSKQRKFDEAIRIANINHQTHQKDLNIALWSSKGSVTPRHGIPGSFPD